MSGNFSRNFPRAALSEFRSCAVLTDLGRIFHSSAQLLLRISAHRKS